MKEDLKNWTARKNVKPKRLDGKHIYLTAYHPDDATKLWDCFGQTNFNKLAEYFPIPDFQNAAEFAAWLDEAQNHYHTMVYRDPMNDSILGMASYMRMDAANGSVEVGCVCHAPKIQRSIATTQAHYLLAKHVFDDLGYRRYEWKLNNENEASHCAARRLGFTFEGVFRNHIVAKGKNRDTAWYAMTNHDWPAIKANFNAWLSSDNFDEKGTQKRSLQDLRKNI